MKKNTIRLNESQLRQIIKESVKKYLCESLSPQEFENGLQVQFEKELIELFKKELINVCAGNAYGPEFFEDDAEEYAYYLSERWTRSAMKILQSDDWHIPHHNFRPLDFVMEQEYNVHNFEELLQLEDSVNAFVDWYWSCYGTHDVCYNFGNLIADKIYDMDQEEGEE